MEALTTDQVRSAINVWPTAFDDALTRLERESKKQKYHQRRNRQARKSHTKTRTKRLVALGIDPDGIKSGVPRPAA